MANRFWVGDGGNWSDALNHWAASSGGAPNASKPTSSDNVFFDANSFSSGSQTVTINESSSCLDMDWTGVTNTPALALVNTIILSGSLVLVSGMTNSGGAFFSFVGSGKTITTNGLSITSRLLIGGGATISLQDDYTCTSSPVLTQGIFTTNGYTFTCTEFVMSGAGTKTLNLGSSVVNCTAWNYSGSNLTLNAGTSTIKVTGTGVFTGGDLTYNNVELNGTAHTISGDNTYTKLSLNPSGAQTITFTDTSTQTLARMDRTGTGVITLTGTGAGGWAVVKTGPSPVSLENTVIDHCTATPDNMWFFPISVNGGNNRNIRYVIPYAGSGWWALRR